MIAAPSLHHHPTIRYDSFLLDESQFRPSPEYLARDPSVVHSGLYNKHNLHQNSQLLPMIREKQREAQQWWQCYGTEEVQAEVVDAMASYGHLLHVKRGRADAAEDLFMRALALNSRHVETLSHYGLLLQSGARQRYDDAEVMYERAVISR